jgi:hypothetical protein
MRCKGIQRGNVFRKDCVPCDLASLVYQVQRRRRQGRNVQGLADVTRGVRSAGMLMDKDPATCEIQQSHAAEDG